MKITIISPNRVSAEDIAGMISNAHSITSIEGGINKLKAVAEQQSDLIIIEAIRYDDLAAVEFVTNHYPKIAIVLLCSQHTPEFLKNAMRAGVKEVLESPANAKELDSTISRIEQKLNGNGGVKSGKILVFNSSKGGCGTTFLATNFGYQLASTGKKVLLIDLNLQFGDAALVIQDKKISTTIADISSNIGRLDTSLLSACVVKIAQNFSVLPAPADPSQSVEVKQEHVDTILNLAVTQYDFVLVDVGNEINPISIKTFDKAYKIYSVLQASLPYIRNMSKILSIFQSLGYPKEKIELVVNRFDPKGSISTYDITNSLGMKEIRSISDSYKEVTAAINQGQPLVEIDKNNAVIKQLNEWTQSLSPKVEQQKGLIDRLFKRA